MGFDEKPWKLPLIADGAVGSILEEGQPEISGPPEARNLSHPKLVEELHGKFADAGAMLHRTNTRQANGSALLPFGLEERVEAINNSGSALLRGAIGPEGLMMGAIGEIGAVEGEEPVTVAERERGYSEQIVFLSDTGVTFLLLEHFSRVEEVLRVLRISKSASDAPVLAQMRLDSAGNSADGLDCREAALKLAGEGADALGISCGPAPGAWPPILEAFLSSGLPVSVMLGVAGPSSPEPYHGAPRLTPEGFADVLAPLAGRGVAIIGGCCGAEPEHIRALAERVANPAAGKPGEGR